MPRPGRTIDPNATSGLALPLRLLHPSRRTFLRAGGASAAGLMFGQFLYLTPAAAAEAGALTSDEALARLMDGNKRFAAGQSQYPDQTMDRRTAVAAGQTPFAFILGCYDSRVSHELAFDQGLGDIFSSRTAGNLLDDAVLGGIEFGVEEFKVPLVVIMGHQRCGAVKATIDALAAGSSAPGSIGRVVELIQPAVKLARSRPGDLLDNSVRANVELGVARLNESILLDEAVQAGHLKIVGARYSLDNGQVEVIA